MGAGPFSSDANQTEQTSTQQQVGASGGSGYGGLNDIKKNSGGVFGGGSTGNVAINLGKAKTAPGQINVVTYDPAAAIEAIHSNQALSTQSVSYANLVAQDALVSLRDLQAGNLAAQAGGNAGDVTGAINGNPATTSGTTKKVSTTVVIGAIASILIAIYYWQNIKK